MRNWVGSFCHQRLAEKSLSVDTNKSKVAQVALDMGVEVINDISGGHFDPNIRKVVAKYACGYIIMQTRDIPRRMQQGEWTYEGGVVRAVCEILFSQLNSQLRPVSQKKI